MSLKDGKFKTKAWTQSANNEFRWASYTPSNNLATWPYIFGILSFLSKKCRLKRSTCCLYLFLHIDIWNNWPIFKKSDMKNMALETTQTIQFSVTCGNNLADKNLVTWQQHNLRVQNICNFCSGNLFIECNITKWWLYKINISGWTVISNIP